MILRVAADLFDRGLITNVDRNALAGYAQSFSLWSIASNHVKREGAVIVTKNGNPVQNPWLAIETKALDRLTKLGALFGLDPANRSRIEGVAGIPPGGEADRDEDDEFFGGPPLSIVS